MKSVFVINGFLDSGKTQFISYTLAQPYFRTKGTTLLIVCEEGEEEYDERLLKATNTVMVVAEDISEIAPDKLMELDKKYKPSRVIFEYNGVWDYKNFKLPFLWKLERAKALGDYLIVALSTDEFNWNEKQKKCYFSYEKRKALLEAIRYVDLVIPEESWEQKKTDVKEYHIDTFVIGDDWKGKFDFLKEQCEVVYLERTPEISTTKIKEDIGQK